MDRCQTDTSPKDSFSMDSFLTGHFSDGDSPEWAFLPTTFPRLRILPTIYIYIFLSGFSFTTIHVSQDFRGRGRAFLNSSLPLPPTHRHLDISQAITAERSPLCIAQFLRDNNEVSIHQSHLRALICEVCKSLNNLNPDFMWSYC